SARWNPRVGGWKAGSLQCVEDQTDTRGWNSLTQDGPRARDVGRRHRRAVEDAVGPAGNRRVDGGAWREQRQEWRNVREGRDLIALVRRSNAYDRRDAAG